MDDDGIDPDDDGDLVQLNVTDVRVAVPAGNGVEAGLVVLEEVPEPHRQLRMYVGQPEARAIHASWSQTVPPRPSTWDLFISTISLLDARIDRAVINDVEEERHYFAQLVLHRAESDDALRLTARPSDAIALVLRGYGARLYARPHVLDAAGLLPDGSHWVRPEPQPAPEPEPVEFDPSVFDAYIAPRALGPPAGVEPHGALETTASDPDAVSDRDAVPDPDAGAKPDPPTGEDPSTGEDLTAGAETAGPETAGPETAGPGTMAESEWEPDRMPVTAEVTTAGAGDAPAGGRSPADRGAAAADRAAAARSARAFRGDDPA